MLVHGDSHLGNVFFHEKDGAAGFYDMQCVAAEHPMRDVAYHLILSCDGADLARNERAYVEPYLRKTRPSGQGPQLLSYEDAWRWRGAAARPLGHLLAASSCRHLGGRVGGLTAEGPARLHDAERAGGGLLIGGEGRRRAGGAARFDRQCLQRVIGADEGSGPARAERAIASR